MSTTKLSVCLWLCITECSAAGNAGNRVNWRVHSVVCAVSQVWKSTAEHTGQTTIYFVYLCLYFIVHCVSLACLAAWVQ